MQELLNHVPEHLQDRFREIVALTDAAADAVLNDEYKQLAREMAVLVCHDGTPATRGKAASWASGIMYELGMVNFLTDPDTEPCVRTDDLASAFGVSKSNMQAKGKVIREGLDLQRFDPDWTLPSMADHNPLMWMLKVNGYVVDIRYLPREAQVAAFEKGLIPYIPADHESDAANEEAALEEGVLARVGVE